MKHPVDVETRVSAELSGFIESLVNDALIERYGPDAVAETFTRFE